MPTPKKRRVKYWWDEFFGPPNPPPPDPDPPSADLSGSATSIPETFPDEVATGLVYTFTWQNLGPDAAVGPLTSPAVTIPAGLTLDSVTFDADSIMAGASYTGGVITIPRDIASGTSATVMFHLTSVASSTDPIAITATLTSTVTDDPVPGNNTVTCEATREII